MSRILHGIQTLTGSLYSTFATTAQNAARLFGVFSASNEDRDGDAVICRYIRNDSGGALTGGLGVRQKSGSDIGYVALPVGATDVAGHILGVLPYQSGSSSLADDYAGYVITEGPAKVVSGAAFAKGAGLKIDAAGKWVAAGVTDTPRAIAEAAAGGADEVVSATLVNAP